MMEKMRPTKTILKGIPASYRNDGFNRNGIWYRRQFGYCSSKTR